MASLSRFSGVLEEELNAHVQKTVPVETKIETKYGNKTFKENNEFEVSI